MRISYSLTALANAISTILLAAGANVTKWTGTNVAAPNVAGVPLVDTHYHRGTAENVLIANRRDVNAQVVGDKTGYGLTLLVQRGTISMGAGVGSNTATLGTAVVVNRSFISHCGQTITGSNNPPDAQAHLVLTNTVTVTATRQGTTGTCEVSFEVIGQ